MKAKVLTRVNVLISLILGMLGFSSCEQGIVCEYGVPAEKYGCPDTTVHVMYGAPSPELDATISDSSIEDDEE